MILYRKVIDLWGQELLSKVTNKPLRLIQLFCYYMEWEYQWILGGYLVHSMQYKECWRKKLLKQLIYPDEYETSSIT